MVRKRRTKVNKIKEIVKSGNQGNNKLTNNRESQHSKAIFF